MKKLLAILSSLSLVSLSIIPVSCSTEPKNEAIKEIIYADLIYDNQFKESYKDYWWKLEGNHKVNIKNDKIKVLTTYWKDDDFTLIHATPLTSRGSSTIMIDGYKFIFNLNERNYQNTSIKYRTNGLGWDNKYFINRKDESFKIEIRNYKELKDFKIDYTGYPSAGLDINYSNKGQWEIKLKKDMMMLNVVNLKLTSMKSEDVDLWILFI